MTSSEIIFEKSLLQLCFAGQNNAGFQLYLLKISKKNFSENFFHKFNIDLPVQIARSVPKRQMEYFFGRMAARYALSALGIEHFQVGTGKWREPIWPEGTIGSISHNGRFAGATVLEATKFAGIGIDIESVLSEKSQLALQDTAIFQSEIRYLKAHGLMAAPGSVLSILFSAKESFFKAAFPLVKRYFDFDAVSLVDFDNNRRIILLEIQQDLCPTLRPGAVIPIQFNWLDENTIFTYCGLQDSS
ncbi:4'-phosphopantetheinyl transferase family protein [Microbulbifer spongiae]|uniref:Enterobactin synthase component D n=1 Tax=Microbulbifer spongiae TaxID=2944933 RepID=A0ABY9E726_9GAMM|nr:4'-phosphopantetheinyl transferase superfamily protein [Microbulbifer sp. MI-G]WKD48146.1 4'-phosphopantetheinyl transferase superfamily protein [Microbulbifer sp. MI-G]